MKRLSATMLAVALALVSPAAAEEEALPAVTVAPVETALLRDTVIASGLIEPVERVMVQPEIEGQAIDTLLADVGDMVEADAPLARLSIKALTLEKSQLAASRASAEASLAQAEAQVVEAQALADEAARSRDRAQTLSERGNMSAAAMDQAVAGAASASARVSVARQGVAAAEAQIDVVDAQIADIDLKLERTTVAAPVAGRIVARNAMVGAIASGTGEPMFEIVRDGLLELRADVAEQDLLQLAPGQPATLVVVGLREPLTGSVRLVEPTIDASTRLGRVRIALDRPDLVRSGLFAEARILVAEREAPALAIGAVLTAAEGASVLTVGADGTVERRPVETGIRDGGLIEIVEGLAPGDRVVARAGAFLRPGDRVNPIAADASVRNLAQAAD